MSDRKNAEKSSKTRGRRAKQAAECNQSWLSTTVVALMLDSSTVYAAMLIDAGELGTVTRDERGNLVRKTAVEAYLAKRIKESAGALSPREAAVQARMYERSDAEYLSALQRHAERETSAPRVGMTSKKSQKRG